MMTKFIKLELRKNKLSTYLSAVLWIFIVGLGCCFFFAFIPQMEAASGGTSSPKNIAIFTEWSNFSVFISTLFAVAFSITSAVMHAKFTVDEYVGKRAILLFSYPGSRGRILFAKCSLVFVFTALASVLCNTVAILIFALFSNIFGILPASFEWSMLPGILSISGTYGLFSASVGLVAMRVGFWKKSLTATVVAAVILIAPFSSTISNFSQYSIIIQLIGTGVLLAAGLLIFMELSSKVNKMQAL